MQRGKVRKKKKRTRRHLSAFLGHGPTHEVFIVERKGEGEEKARAAELQLERRVTHDHPVSPSPTRKKKEGNEGHEIHSTFVRRKFYGLANAPRGVQKGRGEKERGEPLRSTMSADRLAAKGKKKEGRGRRR